MLVATCWAAWLLLLQRLHCKVSSFAVLLVDMHVLASMQINVLTWCNVSSLPGSETRICLLVAGLLCGIVYYLHIEI